jgi:hypothetical protein
MLRRFLDVPGAALVSIALLASACAHERPVLGDSPIARYELREWPKGSVTVAVEDARARRTNDPEQLKRLLKTIVAEALAAAQHPSGAPEELRISIRDHEVFLKERQWNGRTSFRADLTKSGRLVKSWDAFGEDRRWDRRWNSLPSFFDAEDSLQTAFERAVDDLMTKLARRPSP